MIEIFGFIVLALIAAWVLVILPSIRKDHRDNEAKKQTALKNQDTIFRDFFDGSPTKIWKATDNHMPTENMVAGAHTHGYTVLSRDGDDLSTKIVFAKTAQPN